jgi:hypothetical protein
MQNLILFGSRLATVLNNPFPKTCLRVLLRTTDAETAGILKETLKQMKPLAKEMSTNQQVSAIIAVAFKKLPRQLTHSRL